MPRINQLLCPQQLRITKAEGIKLLATKAEVNIITLNHFKCPRQKLSTLGVKSLSQAVHRIIFSLSASFLA